MAIRFHHRDFYDSAQGNYELPPLHTFRNLSSLLVSYNDNIPLAYYNREIALTIAASPNLTRFSLKSRAEPNSNPSTSEMCTSLQTLFGNMTSPQLAELELRGIPLSAAGLSQTLSRKLKSLTICTPRGSRRFKFAWAELFITLEEIGVELSLLSVTGMEAAMDELFSYLISYGDVLQDLKIDSIMLDSQDQEDKAGYRFWDQIVPHHKGSLKVLCITPLCEGEWCYGPAAAAAISQCLSLRSLNMSCRKVEPEWARAKLSLASTKKVIESLNLTELRGCPKNSAVRIIFFLFLFPKRVCLRFFHFFAGYPGERKR